LATLINIVTISPLKRAADLYSACGDLSPVPVPKEMALRDI